MSNERWDEFEAGGERFRVRPLGPKKALAMYPSVARAAGPILGLLANLAKAAPQLQAVQPESEASEKATEAEASEEPAAPQQLSMEDALKGANIMELAGPRLHELAAAFEEMPGIEDTFVRECEWLKTDVTRGGEGTWVKLAPFADQVFQRRHARRVEWLLRCVMIEFADFLSELGL